MADWYLYELTEKGTVRLLRVFGAYPVVEVPEQVAGRSVTEIGDYCFAESCRSKKCLLYSEGIPEEESEEDFKELFSRKKIRELSGQYIRKVVLPRGVATIGNCCFYQCSLLEELVIGNGLTAIGSDAFMNCRSLHNITIWGGMDRPSGLKQILAQRSMETEVSFVTEHGTDAVFLFPEYSETYDEIGPAHIFELNIEGEGFRARQCFEKGILDTAQYDSVFLQACATENARTLCRMALFRLYYPAGLRRGQREIYEGYLKENEMVAGRYLVEEKNLEFLYFAGMKGYFGEHGVAECIRYASERNWMEGVSMLLQYQNQWFAGNQEDEYTFDDF